MEIDYIILGKKGSVCMTTDGDMILSELYLPFIVDDGTGRTLFQWFDDEKRINNCVLNEFEQTGGEHRQDPVYDINGRLRELNWDYTDRSTGTENNVIPDIVSISRDSFSFSGVVKNYFLRRSFTGMYGLPSDYEPSINDVSYTFEVNNIRCVSNSINIYAISPGAFLGRGYKVGDGTYRIKITGFVIADVLYSSIFTCVWNYDEIWDRDPSLAERSTYYNDFLGTKTKYIVGNFSASFDVVVTRSDDHMLHVSSVSFSGGKYTGFVPLPMYNNEMTSLPGLNISGKSIEGYYIIESNGLPPLTFKKE